MDNEQENIPCWECDDGVLVKVLENFQAETKDGTMIEVPNTPILKCPLCGDSVLDAHASEHIEKYLPPSMFRNPSRKQHEKN
jgi:YgiT-type zinc finger domain-containing protein